jgi:hypothetical protein
LNLRELEVVVSAAREREERERKFLAAIQGIDLSANDDHQERFEDVKRRVEARLSGKSEEALRLEEFGVKIIND